MQVVNSKTSRIQRLVRPQHAPFFREPGGSEAPPQHRPGQSKFLRAPTHLIFSQGKISRQIDKDGRVIDLERNKGKLKIIEQEFKSAERIEHWRQKEEEEMRVSED